MTAQDKSLIYTLLKKTATFECGYTPTVFTSDTVDFEDDIAAPQIAAAPLPKTENAKLSAALQATSIVRSIKEPTLKEPALSSLEDIANEIRACHSCRLAENRTNTVAGEGVMNPLVLVVGEGPGHDEDISGRPFVGAAGQLLDKMLAAIQLSRTKNCYIANIVKCRPPNNRTPQDDECAICRKYLDAQIKILKPTLILAMGNTAMKSLLGETGITKLHGIFFNMNGIPVMPTFHPSALLRDESKKADAWDDLKMFRRRLIAFVGDYSHRLS